MYKNLKLVFKVLVCTAIFVSCEDHLDLNTEDERQSAENAFSNEGAYEAFTAKLYAGYSVSGQRGPDGEPDLVGLDEGFSNYMRLHFLMQTLTTDEAVIGWDDGTIATLHNQTWTSGSEFIRTMYSRIMYQVALTNEFIRQTEDAQLTNRGVSNELRATIQEYRAEARFLRALSYWHALDIFGKPPRINENDPVGAYLPPQFERTELFTYIENELLEIESEIIGARQNDYGRADQAAVWMLLAKLYLNAEVYTGTPRYSDVITQVNKIINAGYSIPDVPYQHLFLADNDRNGAQNEFIFVIPFDGINTRSHGLMRFLTHASIGGSMTPLDFGVGGSWGGLRTTQQFVEKFPGEAESDDSRAIFYTDGQSKIVTSIDEFKSGYAVTKWRNLKADGTIGSNIDYPDTDFPMFRLADAYLMYAEAVLRGGGGSTAQAVSYINELRERAYGDTSGNITASDLTLNFILDERARELYWENHRRTDLIRFDRFTTSGIWAFKGGVPQGTTTAAFRNLMPIPASELGVNTNLTQNPGY